METFSPESDTEILPEIRTFRNPSEKIEPCGEEEQASISELESSNEEVSTPSASVSIENIQIQEQPLIDIENLVSLSEQQEFSRSQEEWVEKIAKFLPWMERYTISPDNFQLILNILEKKFSAESENLSAWKLGGIKPILGKLFIPDSTEPTYRNAVRFSEQMSKIQGDLKVLELCTGAGISAMMTWKKIKDRSPDKKCEILSVDTALESLLVAGTLLKLKGVPVRYLTPQDLNSEGANPFDGVSLLLADASRIVPYFHARGEKFAGVISDHGINYFEKELHEEIVSKIPEMLISGGVFLVCALENVPKIALNYGKMVKKILSFGEDLFKTIPNSEKPYEIEEIEGVPLVRAVNSEESAGLYMLLRDYLTKGQLVSFTKLLLSIVSVAKATKSLAREVYSPVSVTQNVLPSAEVVPSYESRKLSMARSLFYIR